MFGMGGTNGTYNTSTFDNGLIIGPMSFEAQGQVTDNFWNLGIPTNYTGRTPASVGLPAQVTDTNLVVAVRASTTSIGHSAPFLNGITVTPDSAPPSMTIDSQRHIVLPGTSLQLHTTAWFTSTPTVQWRIVSGPGQITTTGLYAAPLSVTSGQWVVVRAQDLTTGLSASINLFVPAPGSVIPPNMH